DKTSGTQRILLDEQPDAVCHARAGPERVSPPIVKVGGAAPLARQRMRARVISARTLCPRGRARAGVGLFGRACPRGQVATSAGEDGKGRDMRPRLTKERLVMSWRKIASALVTAAVIVMSAVAATSSWAAFKEEAPEVGRCIKHAGGRYKDSGCKAAAKLAG